MSINGAFCQPSDGGADGGLVGGVGGDSGKNDFPFQSGRRLMSSACHKEAG